MTMRRSPAASARSAGRAESSHVSAAGRAVGPSRLSGKLLTQRAELRVSAGPGRGRLVGGGPLEGRVVASGARVPGGAELDCPVVSLAPPVALRRHVQAQRLRRRRSLPRHPEQVRSAVTRPPGGTGQRRLPVVTISGVGRAARVGQGGIQTLWTQRGGRSGVRSGSGEGGGGGGGRRRSARSTGQGAVTQRDAVEAFT